MYSSMRYRFRRIAPARISNTCFKSAVFAVLAVCSLWLHASEDMRLHVNRISLGFTQSKLGKNLELSDIKAKIQALREQYPKAMSFAELNAITDTLTEHMRGMGFKFHYAYIPPQKPRKGIVSVQVVSVALGSISLKNESGLSDRFIKSQFNHLIDAPLYQPDVDRVLADIKKISGLKVFAYYSKGSKPHAMRLNLQIKQSSRSHAGLSVDNYGTSPTGKYRLSVNGSWQNPLKRADSLSLFMTGTNGERTNASGYLSYQTPLWNLSNRISLGVSQNIFGIGEEFNDLQIEGNANTYRFSYDHIFANSERSTHSLSLSTEQKQNEIDNVLNSGFSGISDEKSEAFKLSWQSRLIKHGSHQQNIQMAVTQGTFTTNNTEESEPFYKLNGQYNLWLVLPSDKSILSSYANLSLRGQYSDKQLSSFDRLVLTGTYAVRSIDGAGYSADSGAIFTGQIYFPKLLDNQVKGLTPYLFMDHAYGEEYDSEGNTFDSGNITSIGVGLDWSPNGHYGIKLSNATTINNSYDDSVKTSRFYAHLFYRW